MEKFAWSISQRTTLLFPLLLFSQDLLRSGLKKIMELLFKVGPPMTRFSIKKMYGLKTLMHFKAKFFSPSWPYHLTTRKNSKSEWRNKYYDNLVLGEDVCKQQLPRQVQDQSTSPLPLTPHHINPTNKNTPGFCNFLTNLCKGRRCSRKVWILDISQTMSWLVWIG